MAYLPSHCVVGDFELHGAERPSESVTCLIHRSYRRAMPLYGAQAGIVTYIAAGMIGTGHTITRRITGATVARAGDGLEGRDAASLMLSKIKTVRRVGTPDATGKSMLAAAERACRAILSR